MRQPLYSVGGRALYVGLVLLAACGFQHGALMGDDGTGDDAGPGSDSGDDGGGGGSDATMMGCAWSYMPTNFDPCMLPAPAPYDVETATSLDVGSTTLPKQIVNQSDNTPLMVDRKSTRLNSSHVALSRMPSSA